MQADRTAITLYEGNRIDAAREVEIDSLLSDFIAHVTADGYEPPRPSIEFALRWWISDRDGMNSTADEDDLVLVAEALRWRFKDKPAEKDAVAAAVYGDGR